MMDPAPIPHGGTYSQDDATDFIRLNGLRRCVNSTMNGMKNLAKVK